MLRPFLTALVLLLGTAVPAAARSDRCDALPAADRSATLARTDHSVSGNRVVSSCRPLTGEVVEVALGGRPAWVLPDPRDRGNSWLVVLDDGSVERVVAGGSQASPLNQEEWPTLAPGEPPLAAALDGGQLVVGSALGAAAQFDDALPGARVVQTPSGTLIALTDPTDRYDHGVLGDDLEASAITLREGEDVATIEVGEPDVIEGTSAMFVDLAGDASLPAVVVTVSNADVGARLVAYDLAGQLVAASEPIGQGYRWLHQIGAGPLGPGGETEIIVVRTPHIGGVVEAHRLVGHRLVRVAQQPGYSSHRLGSSNLDMALLADADGDGRLDVVVPDQGMTELAVLARTADGFAETMSLPLDGTLATNVSATSDGDGNLVIAAGTQEGRLRIYR